MASMTENALMSGIMATGTALALSIGQQVFGATASDAMYRFEQATHVNCQKLHVDREVHLKYRGAEDAGVYAALERAQVIDSEGLDLEVDFANNRFRVTYQGKSINGGKGKELDDILCVMK